MPEIIIVTGKINSGKTTFLKQLIEKEKREGNFPTGIIAPGIFSGKAKIGYDVVNIASEIAMPLARPRPFAKGNIEFGKFYFSEKAFQFAENALMNFKSGGVVFLDEAGPMELNGQGHAASIRALLNSDIARLYIVVREELVNQFRVEFLGERDARIMEIDTRSAQE